MSGNGHDAVEARVGRLEMRQDDLEAQTLAELRAIRADHQRSHDAIMAELKRLYDERVIP